MAKTPKTRGPARPSLDDPDLVDIVCDRLASGEGIEGICKNDDMPSETEFYRRMAKDEVFGGRIARARELQQDFEADNCVKMADAATAENWQVVRLRIWARQWRASKLAPRKYGERVQIDSRTASVTLDLDPEQYREIAKGLIESV